MHKWQALAESTHFYSARQIPEIRVHSIKESVDYKVLGCYCTFNEQQISEFAQFCEACSNKLAASTQLM